MDALRSESKEGNASGNEELRKLKEIQVLYMSPIS